MQFLSQSNYKSDLKYQDEELTEVNRTEEGKKLIPI